MIGFPEHLAAALAERFQEEQQPAGLHLVVVAACGNGKGRGLDQLAAPGMVSKLTYGWAGLSPQLLKQMKEGTVQGWNLPLGVGEVSSGLPGVLHTHQTQADAPTMSACLSESFELPAVKHGHHILADAFADPGSASLPLRGGEASCKLHAVFQKHPTLAGDSADPVACL